MFPAYIRKSLHSNFVQDADNNMTIIFNKEKGKAFP
jgi:hypothetical protein